MALALYRRYRPDTFEGVIGQDQVTVPLMRALDENKLTHAYLFSGPRGCGKTSSARILARCVNCAKGPTSHPCGECESCRDLATGGPGSIDVVEIDAASHNGVDDARELRDRVAAMPARDRYKIFILDEAHMVTPQGFNALLKTVEEPPDHVMFIFATTEPDKVIGTIRSRTHHYPFRLVPPEVMGPYLEDICAKEGIKPEPGVLRLAMRAGGGSVRDTLSVLDQLMVGSVDGVISQDSAVALLGFTPDALIGEAIDAVIGHDGEALYGVVQKVVVGGFDPRRFVEDLLSRVRDLLVLTLGGPKAESVLSDDAAAEDLDELKRQAQALGLGQLTAMAETINTALGSMSGATSPRMRLELLAARLLAGPAVGVGGGAPVVGAGSGAGSSAQLQAGSVASSEAGERVGFAGSSRRQQRGGFAGSARAQAARQAEPSAQAGRQAGQTAESGQRVQSDQSAQPDRPMQSQPERHGQPQPTQPVQSVQSGSGDVAGWGQAQQPASANVAADAQPAPQSAQQPAQSQTPARTSAPVRDDRTPDERWDALVAGLPADVAAYVSREKVPRIKLDQNPSTGAGRLWIKFDVPLSKYAFAIAMADEDVDGSRKVVDILRAETRKAFGEHVQLAPTKKMADGQVAPPLGKLPPEEQSRIKSQIAMAKAGLAAAGLMSAIGGQTSGAAKEPKTGAAPDAASPADADDVHRGGPEPSDDPWAGHGPTTASPAPSPAPDDGDPWASSKPRHAQAGGESEDPWASGRNEARQSAQPGEMNDDPWAKRTPGAGASAGPKPSVAGVSAATTPVAEGSGVPASGDPWESPAVNDAAEDPWASQPQPRTAGDAAAAPGASGEEHHKHVAVPDLSDDTDPWATPPAAQSAAQASPATTNGPSTSANGFAAPATAPSAGAPSGTPSNGNAGGFGASAQQSAQQFGRAAFPAFPAGGPQPGPGPAPLPYEPEPDDYVPDDPWNHPQPPVAQPRPSAAQDDVPLPHVGVDPEDDEYSMNDEVLGQGAAMDVEDLKKLFEVKKVEDFEADDPHNPNNMQKNKNHDDE
ncbi:DNA polymerase III subunits gamma and tau [Bifidobacterium avesanii]|uniref:DNA-directed DNA polymerase n=1 Tax=Bifidobacterium avesanii TaxID=1798157 RepID=A0A7K3TGG4_9BIFI|nr:DNA polymerase III subunit gamma/tau [Bifidobacterium avesanii]KAB8294404.1 DNA polymerase III subunits gamma and tau [Bifidobacterium avesanii]NEG77764.1 DNA polymerase III subunit gamma/tau [Bifidobacterium avesanii]